MRFTIRKKLQVVCRRVLVPIQSARHNLVQLNSQYWVRAGLDADSLVADCGVGNHPDFSLAIMERFGAICHAFEPTRKHHPALEQYAARHPGRFQVHRLAIAAQHGPVIFYESQDNISGSLHQDHYNITRDQVNRYEVQAIAIAEILPTMGARQLDILKLDIEGEEYEVLKAATAETLSPVKQLVVEFHDYCMKRYSRAATMSLVRRIKSFGFKSFTHDGKTFLFFRA